MSAGICIMNRNAIAMAADSAVTVGDHAAIHNSANKLFSLSRVAPVSLIIYANATLMTVPVEIIVKQYKKQLGDRTFPQLSNYVDDFIGYIERNSNLFRFEITEQSYVMQLFCDLLIGTRGDYNNYLNSKQSACGRALTPSELAEIRDAAYSTTISFVDSKPKRGDYHFTDYIKGKYLGAFIDLLGKDSNYSWLTPEQVASICEKACELFDTDFDRNGYVGIAIAGYGEEEIYPHMVHIHVSGFVNGKIRYYVQDRVEISENTPSSIVPLAQTDVMQTFLFGINDRFLNDLSQEIPKQISESVQALDDVCFAPGKKEMVLSQLGTVTGRIIQHMTETAGNKYMRPIIQSVASLPIEELALLAESMINITSLRRKVALDNNIGTVGGPVDVAIISKGDGFIWLKRKHYFDRKYNPQYFYSHFDKRERGETRDDS